MNLSPPRGLLRWLARLPILLYGWGLGRLLGRRDHFFHALHRYLQLRLPPWAARRSSSIFCPDPRGTM